MPRLVCALAAATVMALAAPARAGEDLDRARALYQDGTASFDRGEFRKALAAFEEAERLAVRPEFEFNIGRCYEEIGDAARAVRHFRRYLDSVGASAQGRGDIEAAIVRLERRVGRLDVTVPAGARVELDGEALDAGALAAPIAATEGPHVLVVTLPGRPARSMGVQVVAGQTAKAAVEAPVVDAPAIAPAEPAPTPIYRRWWLWTGVAAVAVAAAAVIIAVVAQPTGSYWSDAVASCPPPCQVRDYR